jgi:ATP-binding cassette subfamily B protein
MKKNKYIRLLGYFKPFIHLVVISILLALLINVSELASPYIMKIAIDDYIMGKNMKTGIEVLGIAYVAAVIGGAVFNYIQVYILNYTGQGIMNNIRIELFSHIQNLPLSFFDRNSSGRIMTRVTNDVEALNELFSGVLVALFKDIFMLIGIVAIMMELNMQLALISFSVIPIIIIVTVLYNGKARWNYKRVRQLIARINGFLAENFSGMKLVQIFNREKEKFEEFKKLNDEYNKASIFEVVLMSIFRPAAELINSLAISLLIWYCIPGVFNSAIEIGVLFAFITYVKKFFGPINDLTDTYNVVLSGIVSADRIFELIDNCEGLEDLDEGMPLSDVKGEIEFRNVWFSYSSREEAGTKNGASRQGGDLQNESGSGDNAEWVLKDVSFRIKPGETAAFVGATGSGKSTIINLIGRFYEIQKGEILLDGINIKDVRLRDLRRHIAVVMQDVFLFSGDIQSNIRLNSKEIEPDEVEKAAQYVNADSFIKDFPDGYHEEVKERGCTLSSGQRQMISFARAIAFNPSILVLDEATSTIDTETEKIIQESLHKVSKDRTTLIIAHRLSTIKDADKIIVIHKGRIREMGRHEELLAKDGIYKNLYDMQYA